MSHHLLIPLISLSVLLRGGHLSAQILQSSHAVQNILKSTYTLLFSLFVTCVSESQILKQSVMSNLWLSECLPCTHCRSSFKVSFVFLGYIKHNKYWLGPGADQFSGFQPSVSSSAVLLPAEGLIVLNRYICVRVCLRACVFETWGVHCCCFLGSCSSIRAAALSLS